MEITLSNIKSFLEERGQVCLMEFSEHFDADPGTIRNRLEVWLQEGKVQKEIISRCCNSGCTECDSTLYEYYTWAGTK
jgi:hypothetical protein